MAFHLNLYHEIHRQEERERRDPFKLAILGILLILCGLSVWYACRTHSVGSIESKRNQLRANWARLEPQMKAAIEAETRLLDQQRANQALVERVHGRFYWAPFLKALAALTPPNIQITALGGDMDIDKERQKSVTVILKGVAAGVQPRTEAESFRHTLEEELAATYGQVSATFDANSLEDAVETVQLEGVTLSTATFRIRVQFKPSK